MAARPAVLIYDGDCPVCRRAAAWVETRARDGVFEYLACQSPERAARFPGMAESACLEAMQLVLPDGTVYSGDAALPLILERLRGWRWLARLLRLPGLRRVSPAVYRFVARHRYAISAIVYRKASGGRSNCPSGEHCH